MSSLAPPCVLLCYLEFLVPFVLLCARTAPTVYHILRRVPYYIPCAYTCIRCSFPFRFSVPSALPQAFPRVFTWRILCLFVLFPVRHALRSLCVPQWVPREVLVSSLQRFNSLQVLNTFVPSFLRSFPLHPQLISLCGISCRVFLCSPPFLMCLVSGSPCHLLHISLIMCFPTGSRWVPFYSFLCLLA